MKRVGGLAGAITVAAAITVATSMALFVVPGPAARAEEPVRLNQVQLMGTHNSYRFEAPWPISLIPALNYSHAPLDLQLGFEGARKVEIDVYSDHATGPFSVKHIPLIDQHSSCTELTSCLSVLKTWSDAHPSHAPVFVHIEPKDDLSPVKASTRYDDLDAAIRSVMGPGDLITPDDVRGSHATVADALATEGWPAIDDVRGRFLFYLDVGPGPATDRYLDGHPELEDRVAFPAGQDGASWAGVFVVNDPVADFDRIRSLVSAGYIVRTRADSDGKVVLGEAQAALDSGAQIISTDFPSPGHADRGSYSFTIPGGTPERCNPLVAPPGCTPGAVESGVWALHTQKVRVSVAGSRVGYTNTADVPPWTFTVGPPGAEPARQVNGSATIPGTNGGDATVTVAASRVLGLPAYVGSVSVSDPGAGVNVRAPLLLSRLPRAGIDGVAADSTPWFSTSGPFAAGSLTWSVTTP
ncbi:MAG: Ca2+-dependent phosphoinositide-specific phospholipase C [Acidimicrobiia bacterium]